MHLLPLATCCKHLRCQLHALVCVRNVQQQYSAVPPVAACMPGLPAALMNDPTKALPTASRGGLVASTHFNASSRIRTGPAGLQLRRAATWGGP